MDSRYTNGFLVHLPSGPLASMVNLVKHALRNFILDFNLTVCIDAPETEVAYTYVSPNGS